MKEKKDNVENIVEFRTSDVADKTCIAKLPSPCG